MTKNLSNRTIGIEFEMYFLTNRFKKLFPTIEIKSYDDLTAFLNENGFNGWEAKRDGSLEKETINGEPCISLEVITPPITFDQAKTQVSAFCNLFKKFSVADDPDTGLHVHVDVSDLIGENKKDRVEALMLMLLKYKSAEPIFDSFVAKQRQKNRNIEFAASEKLTDLLNRYEKAVKSVDEDINVIVDKLSDTRYKKLNIQSLFRFPTVEFRQHEGTLDANKILIWVANCINFVNSIDITNEVFKSYIKDFNKIIENPKIVSLTDQEKQQALNSFKIRIKKTNFAYREMLHSVYKAALAKVLNKKVDSGELYELFYRKINDAYNVATKNSSEVAKNIEKVFISFKDLSPAFTNAEQGLYRLETGNVRPGSTMEGLAIDTFIREVANLLNRSGVQAQLSDKQIAIILFGKMYQNDIQNKTEEYLESIGDKPRALGQHASAVKRAKSISKDYEYKPIKSLAEHNRKVLEALQGT